ncbi:MAG TPA: hypothetical protein VLF39_01515 [Candidatus Saccharimonadales bacterium]|nr:hypothetical protein [Candidatus Saccharimonadales bacterium]
MKTSGRRWSLFIVVLLWLLLAVGWWQHQAIFDWLRLYNYQPSVQVTELATDTTMNSRARHLFYVYHPLIENKDQFSDSCTQNEQTIVLGCYVNRRGIYIYNVADSRLNGVLQVTAAHEMLHAAYDRLSPADKSHVDGLILKAYTSVTDQRIRDTIADYKKAGADTTNELHSILGTEVSNLPPELENYYKRYFDDRAKIVKYSQQYEQAFTERQKAVKDYDFQINTLKKNIDQLENSLSQQLNNLNSQRQQMQRLLNDKNYQAYNAAVGPFNDLVTKYNHDVAAVRALIDQYNVLVRERNNLALEENQLIKAIDSRPDTVQGQ